MSLSNEFYQFLKENGIPPVKAKKYFQCIRLWEICEENQKELGLSNFLGSHIRGLLDRARTK